MIEGSTRLRGGPLVGITIVNVTTADTLSTSKSQSQTRRKLSSIIDVATNDLM